MGIRDRCKQAAFKKSIKQIMQEEEQEEFERTLSLLDLIMIGIGGTVGSGVFSTAGLVMKLPIFMYIKKNVYGRLQVVIQVQQLL